MMEDFASGELNLGGLGGNLTLCKPYYYCISSYIVCTTQDLTQTQEPVAFIGIATLKKKYLYVYLILY